MNWKKCEYIKNIQLNLVQNITVMDIENAQQELGIIFPQDYKDFILFSNGSEGEIGECYLEIWNFEDLRQYYQDYTIEYTPEIVYFATDGATNGYAFDLREKEIKIVSFPMDTIDYCDIKVLSKSFIGFLEYLYKFKWD